MNKLLFALLTIITMSSGCATIVSDSEYPVQINSNPREATCIIRGNNYETKVETPANVIIPTKASSVTINCEKEGYVDGTSTLSRKLDFWYFGNALFGYLGVIGFIVDPITGSIFKYDDFVNVNLIKADTIEKVSKENTDEEEN